MTAATITVEKAEDWDVDGWTSVPNRLIRDTVLTPDGKWAFSWLSSHSREFQFRADDLAAAGPKGRNHARDAIREIERHGWLTRHKAHDPLSGRIIGTVYRLHARPVAEEDRTFVESTAKKRSFPKLPPENRRSEPAPAQSGAGESVGVDRPETPSSGPAPDRSGAGQPGAGQPGTGQPGAPSTDENTTGEHQEEGLPTSGTPDAGPLPQPPPPRITVDLDDRDTWLCERCAANPLPPGAYRPGCGPCGGVRKWALGELARRDEAQAAAARAADEVAEACRRRGWCDDAGYVLERKGVRLAPLTRCQHNRPPALILAEHLHRVAEEERPPDGLDHAPGKPRFVRPSKASSSNGVSVHESVAR